MMVAIGFLLMFVSVPVPVFVRASVPGLSLKWTLYTKPKRKHILTLYFVIFIKVVHPI